MYCRKCGKAIYDDSRFCSYCGDTVKSDNELVPSEFKNGVKKKIAVYGKKGFWELIVPDKKADKRIFVLHRVKLINKKGKKVKREVVHKFQVK